MGRKIIGEEDWNKEFKDYDPQIDERLVLKFTNGEKVVRYIIEPGEYIMFDGKYVVYLGFITDPKSLDPIFAFYKIKGKVYFQKPKLKPIDLNSLEPKKKKEFDDSRLLDVDVKQNDNDLMVIAKQLLKGMTLNQFKALFDNVSTLNNFRREIESSISGNLTWNRFIYLLDLLGCDYHLEVKAPEIVNGRIMKPEKQIKIIQK
jgi:hypothetical protein